MYNHKKSLLYQVTEVKKIITEIFAEIDNFSRKYLNCRDKSVFKRYIFAQLRKMH